MWLDADMRNVYKVLEGKSLGKRPFEILMKKLGGQCEVEC
jgi:hypothetical protein